MQCNKTAWKGKNYTNNRSHFNRKLNKQTNKKEKAKKTLI